MPARTFLLDLLTEELQQEVIRRLSKRPHPPDFRHLSCCCRKLCALVRRTRRIKIAAPASIVLKLVQAPPFRVFRSVDRLSMGADNPPHKQDWQEFAAAVAAAVGFWPQLEEVALVGMLPDDEDWEEDMSDEDDWETDRCSEPGCLIGALQALKPAPALRRLLVHLPDFYSLVHVRALTQLTHLELDGGNTLCLQKDGGGPGVPLSSMPHLVSLKLSRTDLGAAQPCPLPPQLTRLELSYCWTDTMALGPHLVQCQQLQELHLEGDQYHYSAKQDGCARYSVGTHPTLLLQALAGQLTGLQKLHLSDWQLMPVRKTEKVLADVTRRMLRVARMGRQERVERGGRSGSQRCSS